MRVNRVLAALVLASLVCSIFFLFSKGVLILVVLSGSMSPSINAGDLILVSKVEAEDIKEGDIITFKNGKNYVTHRVMNVIRGEDGKLRFKTKGDANEEWDHEVVKAEDLVGKVIFVIPKLGYLINFIRTPLGYILFILLPGTLIIIEETRRILWHRKE